MRITSINWFYPLWLAGAITLAATDRVSWWVVLLIVTNGIKATSSFRS